MCEQDQEAQQGKRKKSLRRPIALLLVKLSTANSNRILSSLFQISNSGVDKAITKARKMLMEKFVTFYLGKLFFILVCFLEASWYEKFNH